MNKQSGLDSSVTCAVRPEAHQQQFEPLEEIEDLLIFDAVVVQRELNLLRQHCQRLRRDIMTLFRSSRHVGSGALEELTVTTNGSQLARFAEELAHCGVRRVNVSLDTLDPQKFKAVTRWGDIDKVLAGIDAAQAAGIAVKINTVALAGVNDGEFEQLIEWSNGRGRTSPSSR